MTHPFDDAIRLDATGTHVRRGRTHPEWTNMVGPFGGITAAAVLHAIESHPDRLGEPLASTVNYAAPIADGDFDISRRTARANRSNQHWIAELDQDGDVKTTATALFALRRDSWADTESRPPSAPAPERLPRTDPAESDGRASTTCDSPTAPCRAKADTRQPIQSRLLRPERTGVDTGWRAAGHHAPDGLLQRLRGLHFARETSRRAA